MNHGRLSRFWVIGLILCGVVGYAPHLHAQEGTAAPVAAAPATPAPAIPAAPATPAPVESPNNAKFAAEVNAQDGEFWQLSPIEMLARIMEWFSEAQLMRIQGTPVTPSNLVLALFIVLCFYVLSRWIENIAKRRMLNRMHLDRGVEFALLRVFHYVIMIIGLYTALNTLNINLQGLIGIVAILGVGIGFGLQTLANNFISGIILLFEQPIKVGDRISVGDVWGDVVQINLRTTVVNTTDNVSIIMPNSTLLENNLINWSYGDPRIRIHIPVGVAYGSNLALVTEQMLGAATGNPNVLQDPEPKVLMRAFGESSLDFDLVCWLPDAARRDTTMDELNRDIDQRFRDCKIEIPFPQRDLNLRGLPSAPIHMALATPPPRSPTG